ncbi:hypothetical protein PSENEW3_00000336 [Picochlorum sp. SENEW3]|nr:hypothetical protein PSENEW3_00000336 [Picochlorum sp. SENEW3]
MRFRPELVQSKIRIFARCPVLLTHKGLSYRDWTCPGELVEGWVRNRVGSGVRFSPEAQEEIILLDASVAQWS